MRVACYRPFRFAVPFRIRGKRHLRYPQPNSKDAISRWDWLADYAAAQKAQP